MGVFCAKIAQMALLGFAFWTFHLKIYLFWESNGCLACIWPWIVVMNGSALSSAHFLCFRQNFYGWNEWCEAGYWRRRRQLVRCPRDGWGGWSQQSPWGQNNADEKGDGWMGWVIPRMLDQPSCTMDPGTTPSTVFRRNYYRKFYRATRKQQLGLKVLKDGTLMPRPLKLLHCEKSTHIYRTWPLFFTGGPIHCVSAHFVAT